MRNLELVSFVKSKLGTPYVYGAKGKPLTQAQINTWASMYPSTFTSTYKAKAQKFIGRECTDCSGLISWFTGKERNSAGYSSTATKKGAIKDIPEIPGLAVWRSGHIGIYIGNGKVIEAKGIDYGTVETVLSAGKWTHYLYLCDITYTDSNVSSPAPSANQIKGLDVSAYQSAIDWKKVAADGYKFAIMRGVTRDGNMDTTFFYNYENAKANNIDVSCYQFSYSLTKDAAVSDAQNIIAKLKGIKIPIWLDLEWSNQGNLGKRAVTDIAIAYINTCKSAGYECHIYSNLDWYKNKYHPEELKALGCKFWIARYANDGSYKESLKPNIGEYIWQWTSKGKVKGINGDVDLNIMYEISSTVPPETKTNYLGKITASALNIRSAPSTAGTILGTYKQNALVQILSEANGWVKTDRGYISKQYVSVPTGVVSNCGGLNVRSEPDSSKNNVLSTLKPGDKVTILSARNSWYEIQLSSSSTGWVSSKYIKIT